MSRNILVGQSGGPTAAINASLAGVVEEAFRQGVPTVYGMRYGIQGFLDGRTVNLTEALSDPQSLELLRRTPSSWLGSCRFKLPEPVVGDPVYAALFDRFAALDIGAVFYIGGNDSMDTIAKLHRYGEAVGSLIRFIGVPKTIDNDLMCTDHTPGYGTAAKYIATMVKELICDSGVYDLDSVTVVEIMGRHAGWLTAASVLCKGEDCPGPDMVLLPEVSFDEEKFLARVAEIHKTKGTVVIAASEGVQDPQGNFLCDKVSAAQLDSFGHKAFLSGTGRYLSGLIQQKLGCKSRAVEFSTVQRSGSHIASATDLEESARVGAAAVQAALEQGNSGLMSTLVRREGSEYGCDVRFADIAGIANLEKKIPADWITPDGFGLTEAYTAYGLPLIQGEPAPLFAAGLPRHLPPLQ